MGNIFDTCKGKQNVIYNKSLLEPLQNNDPYSSINLYNNLDFIELNDKLDKIKYFQYNHKKYYLITYKKINRANYVYIIKDNY